MTTMDSSRTAHIDDVAALPRRPGLLFLVIGFAVADYLANEYAYCLPVLRDIHGHWNWSGKILSIALSCTILGLWPQLRKDAGLRLRQAPGSIPLSVVGFLACLATGVYFGLTVAPTPFSGESLLFSYFIPGIDEELSFRGIGMALIARAYGQSPMSCRLRYGREAFFTSLVFGLFHAFYYHDGHLAFSWFAMLDTGLFASLMAMVRTRSGSLLWPVLSHGAWDGTVDLLRMMR